MKKQPYQSDIADHMVYYKERGQSLESYCRSRINEILWDEDPETKLADWTTAYQTICDLELLLSPTTWLAILEDSLLGATFEDREERYETIVKALPHANGYPMRCNERTFQPELYIDGKWVGIEAIQDPEPELVEQQKTAEDFQTTIAETKEFLAENEAKCTEVYAFMDKVEAELDYDDAMRVVDSK